MNKLGISLGCGFEGTQSEHLEIIKAAGFDSFFTGWSRNTKPEELSSLADKASALGLIYETLHAPFGGMNCIWQDGTDGDDYTGMLIDNINACGDNEIPIMITHVTVAAVAPPPSEVGAARFGRLIETAAKRNVKIAFENLEIPEHLAYIFDRFKDAENIGFCWDCGHNHCYTPKTDMMTMYADKLICTHLHDNFGQKNPDVVTWHDDLHLLPFDGNLDWNVVAAKICGSNYAKDGILTLELSCRNKDEYKKTGREAFVAEAYHRAKRIKLLVSKGI